MRDKEDMAVASPQEASTGRSRLEGRLYRRMSTEKSLTDRLALPARGQECGCISRGAVGPVPSRELHGLHGRVPPRFERRQPLGYRPHAFRTRIRRKDRAAPRFSPAEEARDRLDRAHRAVLRLEHRGRSTPEPAAELYAVGHSLRPDCRGNRHLHRWCGPCGVPAPHAPPSDQRLSLAVDLTIPDWKEYGALDRGLRIALSARIVVALGTLA